MEKTNSLVLELQREALDEKVRVTSLLRKALVVARKLHIKDFDTWANKELSGYSADDTTPDYRLLRGHVMAWNDYKGWVPVYFQNAKQAKAFSSRGLAQAIPEIESLLPASGKPESRFEMPYPEDIELLMLKQISPLTRPRLHLNPAEMVGIVETVRNIILNWTLKLEEEGILGEGMTFSPKEQEKQSRVPQIT